MQLYRALQSLATATRCVANPSSRYLGVKRKYSIGRAVLASGRPRQGPRSGLSYRISEDNLRKQTFGKIALLAAALGLASLTSTNKAEAHQVWGTVQGVSTTWWGVDHPAPNSFTGFYQVGYNNSSVRTQTTRGYHSAPSNRWLRVLAYCGSPVSSVPTASWASWPRLTIRTSGACPGNLSGGTIVISE
jgi:hypothetical protein